MRFGSLRSAQPTSTRILPSTRRRPCPPSLSFLPHSQRHHDAAFVPVECCLLCICVRVPVGDSSVYVGALPTAQEVTIDSCKFDLNGRASPAMGSALSVVGANSKACYCIGFLYFGTFLYFVSRCLLFEKCAETCASVYELGRRTSLSLVSRFLMAYFSLCPLPSPCLLSLTSECECL